MVEFKQIISEEYPRIIKKPELLKQLLLPLELWCLKNAIHELRPQSTREYYVKSILNIKLSMKDGKQIKISPSLSITKKVRMLEKILRKSGIPVPSYARILSTLNVLEKHGFLFKREEENSKADFYWVLNPNFSSKFEDKFKEILKL